MDPFLANRASPLSLAGPRQFISAPLGINDLGHIDTLVISHNHYDHLCWDTLKHLPNRKSVEVIRPTGLAPWFKERGFKNMMELGWHQASFASDVKVTALPAIHHSSAVFSMPEHRYERDPSSSNTGSKCTSVAIQRCDLFPDRLVINTVLLIVR